MPGPDDDHPKKVHEIVADRLRQQILLGTLAPNDRLPPEDELTQEFGIARTTLREALRVLESQGLLRIQRGRGGGPVVTHPDLRPASSSLAVSLQLQGVTLGDVAEANSVIEPRLAGRLAANHSEADLVELSAAVEVAALAAKRKDAMAFGPAAARVHETLVERAGNTTLATLSMVLRDLTQSFYAGMSKPATPALMNRAVKSYRRLIELIEDGDEEAATTHWEKQMAFSLASARDKDIPLTTLPENP